MKRLLCSQLSPYAVGLVFLVVAICITAASTSAPDNDFKATTVFLVRHAEKGTTPPNDPGLLETGRKRSEELARVLKSAGITAIYTSQYLRTKQTAEPLARDLGIEITEVPIQMSVSNPREISQESLRGITERIYNHAGENALVVGHSNTIPEVIRALGGDDVPTIAESAYDNLFVVIIYARGKAAVTHLHYGDHE